jgi:hypothetical protein
MPAKRSSKKKKSKKQLKSPGFAGWAIIFLSVFIVVFMVSMLLPRAEVNVSQTPPQIIRLQLLNGCGIAGAAEDVAKALSETSSPVIFDVIDKANAEVYNFEKTTVIDRVGDRQQIGGFSKAALMVRDLLKIQPDRLLIQRLADNLLEINVTIIIGADYKEVLASLAREVK